MTPRPLARRATVRQCACDLIELAYAVGYHIRVAVHRHQPSALSQSQLRCLMFLSVQGGRTLSDTAAFIGLTLSSTSTLIDDLVGQRLISRRIDREDRRRARLALTPRGRDQLREVLGDALREIGGRLEGLTATKVRGLHHAMLTAIAMLLPVDAHG